MEEVLLHAARQPLLSRFAQEAPGHADVELRSVGPGGTVPVEEPRLAAGELVTERWRDPVLGVILGAVLLLSSVIVVVGFVDCLFFDSSQRGWVFLGLAYYIGTVWRSSWDRFMWLVARNLYVRIVVRRIHTKALYESIAKRLEDQARLNSSELGSRDCEAFTEYDKETGDVNVRFTFWGVHGRTVKLRLGGDDSRTRSVVVEYQSGNDITFGRDAKLERDVAMVLWLRTSGATAAEDKVFLQKWCEECMDEVLAPPADRVEIYGLQESSSDWIPEWQLERTKALKKAEHAGAGFYLERQVFDEVRADAELWASKSLRLYMVTGPPGTGKSEFTVWLAGRFRLPIYRLSLATPRLTDARLAQLLSQSSMKHESVVVQIDEFQEVLKHWNNGTPGVQVTPGGFNEVLQGAASLTRGIIVISGLDEVTSEANQRSNPALFRRFQLRIRLGYLERDDVGLFFRNFVREFVDNSDVEWRTWEEEFLESFFKRSPGGISIDMVKQYLMQQITQACVKGLGVPSPATGHPNKEPFRVARAHKAAFLSLVASEQAADCFFRAYVSGASRADIAAGGQLLDD